MAVLVEPGKHMARSYRDGAKRTTGQCCKPHLTLVSGTDSHPGIDYFGDPAVVISVVVGVDLVPFFIQTGIDQERVGIRHDDKCGVTLADI